MTTPIVDTLVRFINNHNPSFMVLNINAEWKLRKEIAENDSWLTHNHIRMGDVKIYYSDSVPVGKISYVPCKYVEGKKVEYIQVFTEKGFIMKEKQFATNNISPAGADMPYVLE